MHADSLSTIIYPSVRNIINTEVHIVPKNEVIILTFFEIQNMKRYIDVRTTSLTQSKAYVVFDVIIYKIKSKSAAKAER